jgi:ABC-type Na+ efflux pump permease subunit
VKSFLLLSLIGFFAVTAVMAVVFRNQRAKNTLLFVRNVGWAYVAMVIGLAIVQVYREGW